MSRSPLLSSIRSTDHDLTRAISFLEEYAKNFYSHHISNAEHLNRNFVPHFDLEEHSETYELYGELPGFHKDNLTIEVVDERSITISGSLNRHAHQTADATAAPLPASTGTNGESSTLTPGIDANDPFVKVQQHHVDVASAQHHEQQQHNMTPFADVLNPSRPLPPLASHHKPSTTTSPSTDTVPAAAPAPPTATATTTAPPAAAPSQAPAPAQAPPHPRHTKPTPSHIRYFLAERRTGSFLRSFHFPSPILRDDVTAKMQDGILHLTARRAAVPPPVKVDIRRGSVSVYDAFGF